MSLNSFVVSKLLRYGHLPKDDYYSATVEDTEIQRGIASFRTIMGAPHDMPIEQLFNIPRCSCPDFSDEYSHDLDGNFFDVERVGSGGNWPRCHGIGEFHAANVRILNAPPAHLARNGNFEEVLRRVTRANQQIGLQLYWSGPGSPIQDNKSGYQLTIQFVPSSRGWIGLAQVASNRPCNSVLWSRYLATYLRTASDEAIRRMWSVLIMHELGHNMGTGHTRGGIMNPSILSLAASWNGDPLSAWLRTRYGGEAIPVDDAPIWGIPQPENPSD